MFVTVQGQKEASPRDMEQRRSLSSVLTLFLTLSRLVFLNRGMRETEWKRNARKESKDISGRAFFDSTTLHNSTKFYLRPTVYRGTQECSTLQVPGGG